MYLAHIWWGSRICPNARWVGPKLLAGRDSEARWVVAVEVQEKVNAAVDALEEVADPCRDRPRWSRLVDPFDVAGKAARSVLPTHPTPALAHGIYYLVLGGFVVFEVVEPPVALLLAAGHLMLASHNRYLQEAGAALEDAG
jgi:hypothetical protein